MHIIGADHEAQWKDPSGDFRKLLEKCAAECLVELIAEEAYSLPTTVGQRLACRRDVPWIDFDMNSAERLEAGISEELSQRPTSPIFSDRRDRVVGGIVEYLPRADGLREEHWVRRLLNHRADSVIVVCGALHVKPLAGRLIASAATVHEIEAWNFEWHIRLYGTVKVVERNGVRWVETRR